MLLGLAGLGLPILIHLIQRQRLRPQMLATLKFLDREDVANAFAPVPRDLVQLLLRLALLALFVLLMARLFATTEDIGPRTLAIVLDQSMSMQQYVAGKQTRFERCRQQILDVVAGLRPQDKMSLLVAGDTLTLETGYLSDKQQLARIVRGVQVSDSGGLALVPTIRAATAQLRSRREVNACVLVYSDQQRADYLAYLDEAGRTAGDNPTLAFRDALEQSEVRLLWVQEESEPVANVSIDEARFTPERVYVGASSRLTAVVRNRSDQPQTVRLAASELIAPAAVDDAAQSKEPGSASQNEAPRSATPPASAKAGQERTVSLEPGEAAHFDLVHRFESPVDAACWVEIDDDALPGDNRFYLPMRMKDRRQILLVVPGELGQEAEAGLELGYRSADLLSYALNPGEALGQGAGTYVNVKRVTPPQLERVSLPLYAIVILHGAVDLPEQSSKDLAAFLENGGGLWLIPDAETAPLRFNELFGGLLGGLTIGQLKQPDAVQPLGRNESQIKHPLLLPLLREEWGSVRDIYFAQYFGIETSGSALPVLCTEGGDPLAVLIRRGRGQVFLQLFPCDLGTSNLPRSTCFVPLVQQVVVTLGERGERQPPDVMRVGQVRRMHVAEFRNLQGDVQVAGPQSARFPLAGLDRDEIHVDGLLHAGAYSVTHPRRKSGRTRWLAVNPVEGESDLAPLSDEDQAQLWGATHAARVTPEQLNTQFSRRHEMIPLLVVLVLIAFAVEALWGAWQSRRGARRDDLEEVPA